MNKTDKLDRIFRFLWSRKHRTNKEWDEILQTLIRRNKITKINHYHVTFEDKYVVWIANHPYSSGSLYGLRTNIKCSKNSKKTYSHIDYVEQNLYHCSKKTAILLEDCVNNHLNTEGDAILSQIKKELAPITINIE